jgi:hypothetical protein
MLVGGLDNMYVFESIDGNNYLTPINQKGNWYRDSIHVFQADFTVDDDKFKLVDTVLGLYAHALLSRDEDTASQREDAWLHEEIRSHKKTVFPDEYFEDLIPLLEENIQSMDITANMTIKSTQLPTELAGMEKHGSPVRTGQTLKNLLVDVQWKKRRSQTRMRVPTKSPSCAPAAAEVPPTDGARRSFAQPLPAPKVEARKRSFFAGPLHV